MIKKLLIGLFLFYVVEAKTQVVTQYSALKKMAEKFYKQSWSAKERAVEYAKQKKLPVKVFNDTSAMEIQWLGPHQLPQYLTTHNYIAGLTISTDKVYSGGGAGLALTGSGVTIREWDAGGVRTTHQEFGGRVQNMNSMSLHGHSTHVAGTLIAAGVFLSARGMATAAGLRSFDWNDMNGEMADEAALGCLVSNHSYGWIRGWSGSTWWGDTTVSKLEDYKFGYYDETARAWDEIAYYAPYYLIVKSAGNDRDDTGDGTYPPDGPYDCIDQLGSAKNILTVGAVNDIANGYSKPSDVVMTGFSSWGPVDDGRIKPDLVANGTGLTSSYSSADTIYASMTGTSMAAPSVTGSLALLIQHYSNLNGASRKMRASTLKALAIHSADEAGDHDGPDYEFGWGLMNTKKAALKISQSDTLDVILEKVLENGQTYKKYFTALNDDSLRVTLVWTDPPGKMPENLEVDPDDPALVNDLDLVVIDTTDHLSYYPWTLDKENPSDSAVKAVNNVDNVEQVDIHHVETGHVYAVMVTHKNVLRNDRQLFSLVISAPYQNVGKPVPDFFASTLSCAVGQTVYLFDASEKKVQSRAWNITPSTYEFKNGTGASSENPVIVFNEPGQYQVALTVTNATGDSTLTRAAYITVGADPSGYCEAYSMNSWGHIKKVQFCNLTKESAATNVGDDDPNDKYYQDWTGNSTKVVRGQTRELFIENSVTDPVYTPYLDVFVWIDWNRDGDFFDEGELVVSDVDNGGGGSFYVKIPLDASLGRTRMRIRSHYKNDYGANSCGYTDYGEVEDYTLEIVDPEPIVWTGSVSSDWADENNWDLGKVPDFLNDVTVPASPSGGRFPVVNAGDTLGTNSVTIENGSQLQVNGQLSIYH